MEEAEALSLGRRRQAGKGHLKEEPTRPRGTPGASCRSGELLFPGAWLRMHGLPPRGRCPGEPGRPNQGSRTSSEKYREFLAHQAHA